MGRGLDSGRVGLQGPREQGGWRTAPGRHPCTQSRRPWLHTGHACPFHWPRSDPGAGLRRAVGCGCSKRGWAGETTLDRVSGHRLHSTHTHRRAHTHTHALPGHVGRAAALPYAHRPLTRSGPPVWMGQRGPPGGLLGPTVGGGVSLGVKTQCGPPPAWDSWLNVGGRRPRFSCEAGRGESSSGEAGPMDGRRAGQSHLCSAS